MKFVNYVITMNQKIKDYIKKLTILPIYWFFRKLPVINDLIIFESNVGRNYSGNPKYIYEEMVRQGLDNKLQIRLDSGRLEY